MLLDYELKGKPDLQRKNSTKKSTKKIIHNVFFTDQRGLPKNYQTQHLTITYQNSIANHNIQTAHSK